MCGQGKEAMRWQGKEVMPHQGKATIRCQGKAAMRRQGKAAMRRQGNAAMRCQLCTIACDALLAIATIVFDLIFFLDGAFYFTVHFFFLALSSR